MREALYWPCHACLLNVKCWPIHASVTLIPGSLSVVKIDIGVGAFNKSNDLGSSSQPPRYDPSTMQ